MASSESPKRLLFRQFAVVAKAVAHEHRLELLEALAQGERSVETRRDGKFVYYGLSDTAVLDLVAALSRIGERHVAEVDKIVRTYFNSRDALEPVSRADLLARMKKGDVQVLDVRPADEFELAHIPGAISIPLAMLKKKLAMLDPDKEIVAYCRGAWCVLSFDAVALLRDRGYRVRRLEDGLPEWQAADLPIAR
jgi:rhodanese-related sulfurtransferase